MSNTQTTLKSFSDITSQARKEAENELEAWTTNRYNNVHIDPPDVLLILDQFDEISKLLKRSVLPMELLRSTAEVLYCSENTSESAIGNILRQCIAEIKPLLAFCDALDTKSVAYPVQDPLPEPPKTEPPKTEPPKTEPPKTEPPKTEPPKTYEP